jgi:hypothetical protein
MPRLAILGCVCWLPPLVVANPRFDIEVMAVLSRAGCNQGACHGNLNGKGGFKLSLRGENADWDYLALTRSALGRRLDPLRPEESLLLQKATATVPHEGGRRFEVNSWEHQILRDWIAAGSPRTKPSEQVVSLSVDPPSMVAVEPVDRVSLKVQAVWSNGRRTEVTRLATFEVAHPEKAEVDASGVVKRGEWGETTVVIRFLDRQIAVPVAWVPARPDFVWSPPPEINFIDRHIFAKLRTLRIHPSGVCDDSTFLRRVFLDVIGTLPTPAEVRHFLADTNPDKRRRIVDDLLQRPEFASYWALLWADLLRVEEKSLDRKGVEVFHGWLRRQIAMGRPLNDMVRDLLLGRGSTYVSGPANYYRALRDPTTRAEAAAQVFLGVRLQCARCHNHPFDRWTMDDYYGLAAFFSQVNYRVVENRRSDNLDRHEFVGEQIVWLDRRAELLDPRNQQPVPPRIPDASFHGDVGDDRLAALASWICDPANPYLARVQANRVWARLMGRGLVDPVDDFRPTNPPSHPALLDDLAHDFAHHGFDLRHLVRRITESQTYQLSAEPVATNADDDSNFSHAVPRRLTAEVLLDAVAQVIGTPVPHAGQPAGRKAIELAGVTADPSGKRIAPAERFLRAFGKPERLLTCECERRDDTTVPQALLLLNGEIVNRLLRSEGNRIQRFVSQMADDATIVEDLWLAALSRLPTVTERTAAESHLRTSNDRRLAIEDLVWALLNSKEFQIRK